MIDVDVVILSREEGPLLAPVQRGLDAQPGVRLRVHRVVGQSEPGDENRWATIARLRNAGKRLGSSPWLMFLDDDVELTPGAIHRLVTALAASPRYGALAADYQQRCEPGPALHVAMGATLFRRSALALIRFRWAHDRCECRCCCDDLRYHGLGIAYCPGVRARHWHDEAEEARRPATNPVPAVEHPAQAATGHPQRDGCVFAAFNRRHFGKFRRHFLDSLRRWGNRERVLVVSYGLYPSERTVLQGLRGVEHVLALPDSGELPPVRRLRDFQTLAEGLPSDTPVAYWDAADVVFQDRLDGLWRTVCDAPDKLAAVREPRSYPYNVAVTAWTQTITDRECRQRAFSLMKERPFLNSGFAAGTAQTMLAYLEEADRLRHSQELRGSTDWGDQMALNLYCHAEPGRWREIEEGWNYCVHDRAPGEVRMRSDGRFVCRRGTPIHAVHGNAHSQRKLELAGF